VLMKLLIFFFFRLFVGIEPTGIIPKSLRIGKLWYWC